MHPCPFCLTGRVFAMERNDRPKFVEYACFSCGWREYSPETAGKRRVRLEAQLAHRDRFVKPKPKSAPRRYLAPATKPA